jgi:hypothetical protein
LLEKFVRVPRFEHRPRGLHDVPEIVDEGLTVLGEVFGVDERVLFEVDEIRV